MSVWRLVVLICWTWTTKHTRSSSPNWRFIVSLVHLRISAVSLWFVLYKPLSTHLRKVPESASWALSYTRTLMLNLPLPRYPRRRRSWLIRWMIESRMIQLTPFPKASLNRKKSNLSTSIRCLKSFTISASQEQLQLKSLTVFSVKQ